MPQDMRIWVTGSSGSGKSTLTRKLGPMLHLPMIHLDQLYFEPDWQAPPPGQFEGRVKRVVSQDNWIIDGGFTNALGDLVPRHATHIIFFDIPRLHCIAGVIKRVITTYGQVRPDAAPGCPERLDLNFFGWVWHYKRDVNPRIEALINARRPEQAAFTLHNRKEGDAICATLLQERF